MSDLRLIAALEHIAFLRSVVASGERLSAADNLRLDEFRHRALAAPQPEPPAGLREAIAALPVSKRHSDDWIERAAVYRLIEGAT